MDVYGVLHSTAVAGLNVYRSMTDRRRLSLSMTVRDAFSLAVTVKNASRSAIWLVRVGGESGSSPLSLRDEILPMKLEPGETYETTADIRIMFGPDPPRFFAAWDSLNRPHKLPRHEFKALLTLRRRTLRRGLRRSRANQHAAAARHGTRTQ